MCPARCDAVVTPDPWTGDVGRGRLPMSDATVPRGTVGRHGRPVREDDTVVERVGATVTVPFAE